MKKDTLSASTLVCAKSEKVKKDPAFVWLKHVAVWSDMGIEIPLFGKKKPLRIGVDPIVGFFLPILGDALLLATLLPTLWITMFRVRSLSLTVAVIFHALVDAVVGCLPFFVGDILDIFIRSNGANYRLIVGYVENDPVVRREVKRKALLFALGSLLLLGLLLLLIIGVGYLLTLLYHALFGG